MLQITKATFSDLAIIQRLAHQIWPETYKNILSADQLKYMLDKIYSLPALTEVYEKPNHYSLLAVVNEAPCGFGFYHLETPSNNHYHLDKLYLESSFQAQGNGKKMMSYIFKHIHSLGASSISLNVNRKNKAVNFYLKLGFKIIAEKDISIGNGFYMNDYVMETMLE